MERREQAEQAGNDGPPQMDGGDGLARALQRMNRMHQHEMAEYDRRRQREREAHQREMAEYARRHQEEMAAHQREMAENARRHQEEMAAYARRHQEEMAAYARRRQQEREEHEREMERIRQLPLFFAQQRARQPAQVVNIREVARPVSRAFLDAIPRIHLAATSNVFWEATLQVRMGQGAIPCFLGEFGPTTEHQLLGASLVLCPPRMGGHPDCSGILEERLLGNSQVVAFMHSGGGLSSIQKALMAQGAGASAVIIGNTDGTPWPHVMRDSEREAEEGGLAVPVAMINEAHSRLLLEQFQEHEHQEPRSAMACCLHITAQDTCCAICHEQYAISETVMEIPECGHVFHEECAMAWLQSRHTCPLCFRQLPTDP
jgi:Ring finger domain